MKDEYLEYRKTLTIPTVVTLGETELEVGQHYWLSGRCVRFIKVTRKGFNFLDESTSRCLLKRHLYPIGYSGKELPRNKNCFVFRVNVAWFLRKVAQAV